MVVLPRGRHPWKVVRLARGLASGMLVAGGRHHRPKSPRADDGSSVVVLQHSVDTVSTRFWYLPASWTEAHGVAFSCSQEMSPTAAPESGRPAEARRSGVSQKYLGYKPDRILIASVVHRGQNSVQFIGNSISHVVHKWKYLRGRGFSSVCGHTGKRQIGSGGIAIAGRGGAPLPQGDADVGGLPCCILLHVCQLWRQLPKLPQDLFRTPH